MQPLTAPARTRPRSRDAHERLVFLRQWAFNPRAMGALLPSGTALAQAITQEIHAGTGAVVELGSGTGVFTRQLLARGVPMSQLVLVEANPLFAQQLAQEFHQALVLNVDAARLARHAAAPRPGSVGAVVCGLPLLNLSLRQQLGVLASVLDQLQPKGALYLFTYGPQCPVPLRVLDRLGLRARRIKTVVMNMPPAHVWKINRRARP